MTAVWSRRISSEETFGIVIKNGPSDAIGWLMTFRILNDPQRDPVEMQYRIRYAVKNQQQESTGTAIKTVKLEKLPVASKSHRCARRLSTGRSRFEHFL